MISKQTDALLGLYADKRQVMEDLESELETLSGKVLKAMEKEGLDTIATARGTLSKVSRTKWEYSSAQYKAFLEKQKQLKKAAEETEQEAGRAVKVESIGLSYRKNEKEN